MSDSPIPADILEDLGDITAMTLRKAEDIWTHLAEEQLEPSHLWGWGPNPEHNSRRALDIMCYTESGQIDRRVGDETVRFLWENADRFGIRHLIWRGAIISTVRYPGKWRSMTLTGNATRDHYDHVHVLFLDDRYTAPRGYTGSGGSTAPTPTGSSKLKVDGKLGPATIRRWQQVMGTTPDGEISEPRSSLVLAVQKKLNPGAKLRLDGRGIQSNNGGRYPARGTTNTIRALQRYLRVTPDGYLSSPRSNTVKALQRRLNEGKF